MAAQMITRRARSVAEVAQRLLGIQAQDLAQAQWALALRAEGATLKSVEQAFDTKQIVRTWPMRGTLHVVAADDASWLTALFAKRNLARAASRHRALGIGPDDLRVARETAEKVLAGQPLRREALFAHFERAGQRCEKQRGAHLLWHLAQDGVVCLAGEQFVLVDEWISRPRRLDGDEALGELAARYLRGHGPATPEDLAFWSGLPKGQAKRALDIAGCAPSADEAGLPEGLLLPGFDEYLLGYADRSHCLEARYAVQVVPGGNGVFLAMIVLRGRVLGTWRRRVERERVTVTFEPFEQLAAAQREALEAAAQAYGVFHDKPVSIVYVLAGERREVLPGMKA